MAAHVPQSVSPLDPARWHECHEYLHGIDLLNHGYYWEAHEAWEALWHAAGRSGLVGDFLKGLIKLAAAGVKAREGRPLGVARHARRAESLFRLTAERIPQEGEGGERHLLGLSIDELQQFAAQVAAEPPFIPPRDHVPAVDIVFDFILRPTSIAPGVAETGAEPRARRSPGGSNTEQ